MFMTISYRLHWTCRPSSCYGLEGLPILFQCSVCAHDQPASQSKSLAAVVIYVCPAVIAQSASRASQWSVLALLCQLSIRWLPCTTPSLHLSPDCNGHRCHGQKHGRLVTWPGDCGDMLDFLSMWSASERSCDPGSDADCSCLAAEGADGAQFDDGPARICPHALCSSSDASLKQTSDLPTTCLRLTILRHVGRNNLHLLLRQPPASSTMVVGSKAQQLIRVTMSLTLQPCPGPGQRAGSCDAQGEHHRC